MILVLVVGIAVLQAVKALMPTGAARPCHRSGAHGESVTATATTSPTQSTWASACGTVNDFAANTGTTNGSLVLHSSGQPPLKTIFIAGRSSLVTGCHMRLMPAYAPNRAAACCQMEVLDLRYLIGVLCALALLASWSFVASAATVVGCGVVAANSITAGEGSGPRTFELREVVGASGGRFSVPEAMALPTIGSYICGQFNQGAPSSSLVALLRPGDAGYIAQAGTTPLAGSLPSTTTAQSQTGTLGTQLGSLVIGLAAVTGVGLLLARSRRSSVATTEI